MCAAITRNLSNHPNPQIVLAIAVWPECVSTFSYLFRWGPAPRPPTNRRGKSIKSLKKGPNCYVDVGPASSLLQAVLSQYQRYFTAVEKGNTNITHGHGFRVHVHLVNADTVAACAMCIHYADGACARTEMYSVPCATRNHGDFAVLFIS